MRIKGLTRMFRGSRTNDTPRLTHLCPKRRPPRPQHSDFSVFHRGGLHFGHHTTSNRDLTATKRGKWRHENHDTPATRQQPASNAAKPPPPPAWRAPEGPQGPAAEPVGGRAGQRANAPIEARGADGRSGRHRDHRQPNFARNLSRSFFEMPQKRWNSSVIG